MSIDNETAPLVSVLMTAYNREKYIADAIESVLNSTFDDFELIICDDNSKDNTVAIANEYAKKDQRIKLYINNKNLGDYPNRNKAASYASGKYIKYLDSDDFMYPHCLQVMVSAMEKFPGAGFGLSADSQIDKAYPVCLSPSEAYKEHFEGFGHFNRAPGSAIINRDCFNRVGCFSGKRWVGDSELWFHMARYFSLVKFPRDLVWDRVHIDQEKVLEQDIKNIKLSARMRKELNKEVLTHPDCPLSTSEIKKIQENSVLKKN